MYTLIVTLDVKPEREDEFLAAIRINSIASLRDEPGCLRFDVLRSEEIPHRYFLYEIYRDVEAFRVEHRQAPHYAEWKAISQEVLVHEGHHNDFGTPVFPELIPEAPHDDE